MGDTEKMAESFSENERIIAIVGPTGVGKTALAVEIAKIIDGEIISCDSMQIYEGMDIGTAKVRADEACGIRHHLIDIRKPNGDFSCAEYAEEAKKAIADIRRRGKRVIFCGGTGLYLDSVLGVPCFSTAGIDEEFRLEMQKKSPDELYEMLCSIDPESAETIHKNNVKRVIRALEIYKLTGKTKSSLDARSEERSPLYESVIIGLDMRNRTELYDRINKRMDIMLENGLIDEVKRLDTPSFRASTASDGIGYKELLSYLDGEETLENAVERIKQASRNYAKRQLTWFRRNKAVKWIFTDDFCGEEKFKLIVNSALKIINNL